MKREDAVREAKRCTEKKLRLLREVANRNAPHNQPLSDSVIERLNRLLRMTVPVPSGCVAAAGQPMSPEFRASVQLITDDGVHFIIHARGHSSDTLDLVLTSRGLTLLAPFEPGETQAERIARTAAIAATPSAGGVEEMREALDNFCRAAEYWAGCDEDCSADEAFSEILGSGGAWPAEAYARARGALEGSPLPAPPESVGQ
jgi:hypothetical protein